MSLLLGLIALILGVLAGAFVLHLSVAMVGGDRASDKNTCGTAVGVVITANLLGALLGLIPLVGFPLFVIAWFLIVMGAYDIGFARACAVAFVNIVLSILIQLVLGLLFGITAFGALAMARALGVG